MTGMTKADTRTKRIVLFLCLFAYLCYVALSRARDNPTALVLLTGVGILVAIFLYPGTKKDKPTKAEETRARAEEKRWKKKFRIHRDFRP
jgi:hypothetical protein